MSADDRYAAELQFVQYLAGKAGLESYSLERTANLFWGLVTKNVIVPTALLIHQTLKERGISERGPLIFNDLDHKVFFVESNPPAVCLYIRHKIRIICMS